MFKKYIQKKLERYVSKYLLKHPDIKVVAVAGSVGKTSTKIAIGTVLSERFRVRLHEGNHNAEVSAPLAILGIEYPDNIRSIGSWLEIFSAARRRIKEPSDVDVIIQELGTDRIGQIPHFGTYVRPYLSVITAVSPEHMEFFGTLDAVAREELAAANYSEHALISRDNIAGEYAQYLTNPRVNTYGNTDAAEYHFIEEDFTLNDGFSGSMRVVEWPDPLQVTLKLVGEHSIRAAIAATAVAAKLGMTPDEVARGLSKVRPVPGRMNILRGLEDSIIIDDSYNSSPLAAVAAIQALYGLSVPQRIAVLGSMNELGAASAAEHEALGKLCDPSQIAHVVTVGADAEAYLAPAARARGCHVVSFKSALEAGGYVHKVLEPHAAVLFKGSQGNVYLEEAIKVILHATEEDHVLVRQSPQWLEIKNRFFSELS